MRLELDKLIVRDEEAAESAAVYRLNKAAFGRRDEAELVDRLRAEGVVLVSLVAALAQQIVGHILFSRMSIETGDRSVPAAALAPMAVSPEWQRRGIGGRLILHGLDSLRRRGEQVAIVLGHAEYYPRFGFSSEKAGSLAHPFPRGALMAMEITPGSLDGIRGRVRYPAAFGL